MSGQGEEKAAEIFKQEVLQTAAYQLERDRKAQEEKARCLVEKKPVRISAVYCLW